MTHDCLFQSISVVYLGPERAERETGEDTTGSQIITGKCVLGGGVCCPSQGAGGAVVKQRSRVGWVNVTLALVCRVVSH